MKRSALALLGLTAALPLSGCISLSPKPPARLMVLSATTPVAPGTVTRLSFTSTAMRREPSV